MFLQRFTLKDFAGVESATIEGLEPGLNIVVGDNEAGKSTLLMALRAALFQKHRASGEAARALAPYGRQCRPEIGIDFRLGEVAYALTKAFVQRPEASLSWTGGNLTSDAVEEKLAELFRFSHPGRGESKLDAHQGAFGLLWVEQGRSPGGLDLGVGKDAVTASLEGEVGQILGGERGRSMLAAAKARQDRFFTDTGRPKVSSPLKLAEDELAALCADLESKKTARRDYDARIDRLRDVRERLDAYRRDDVLAEAETAFEAARQKAAGLESLRRDLEAAETQAAHATAKRLRAAEMLQAREALTASAEAAGQRAEVSRARLAELSQEASRRSGRLRALEAAAAEARSRADAAEQDFENSQRLQERERLAAELGGLQKRLGEARELAADLAALRAQKRPGDLDAEGMKAIDMAERGCSEARIRQAAAASLVTFLPEKDALVTIADGGTVDTASPLRVSSDTEFVLPGFGRVRIAPGGHAGELAKATAAARERLDGLLRRCGAASVEEALELRARAEERALAERALSAELKLRAPDGIGALEEEERHAAQQLAALPEPEPSADHAAPREALRSARDAARTARGEAERQLALSRAENEVTAATLVRTEADADHASADAERLARQLREAEGAKPLAGLNEDLAAADTDRAAADAVLGSRRRAFDGADPEAVRLEALRAGRALESLKHDVGRLEHDSVSLEAEIRALGLQNLGEEIARLEGEIEALEGRRAKLSLEAEASRLLYATLAQAQREAREHWLGPIKTQVAPYLRLIQPESEITLDEDTLEIKSLFRRGVEEDFKRLSAGAREQVAVVTRLALADVLKRGGHPAAVILDDALVNTDEKRLARMHLVLQKAAEGLQIIVLTCRERDFRGLGAPIFRL